MPSGLRSKTYKPIVAVICVSVCHECIFSIAGPEILFLLGGMLTYELLPWTGKEKEKREERRISPSLRPWHVCL